MKNCHRTKKVTCVQIIPIELQLVKIHVRYLVTLTDEFFRDVVSLVVIGSDSVCPIFNNFKGFLCPLQSCWLDHFLWIT